MRDENTVWIYVFTLLSSPMNSNDTIPHYLCIQGHHPNLLSLHLCHTIISNACVRLYTEEYPKRDNALSEQEPTLRI